jgi:hypothetical protein
VDLWELSLKNIRNGFYFIKDIIRQDLQDIQDIFFVFPHFPEENEETQSRQNRREKIIMATLLIKNYVLAIQ